MIENFTRLVYEYSFKTLKRVSKSFSHSPQTCLLAYIDAVILTF